MDGLALKKSKLFSKKQRKKLMSKLNPLQKLINKLNYNCDDLENCESTYSLDVFETMSYDDERLLSFMLWTKKYVYFFVKRKNCTDLDTKSVLYVPINLKTAIENNFF